MFHLTLRVAWHDSQWSGRICQAPSDNAFCIALKRIHESRDDEQEDANAGSSWSGLAFYQLPPCSQESGAFMSTKGWSRRFVHPYASGQKTTGTHGHLEPTVVKLPPFSTFAVPFAWMLQSEQANIDGMLPAPLPADEASPFKSSWVFGRSRQQALLNHFFGRLGPDRSLVFFYCKEGQPLGDTVPRLVVGVGRITSIGTINEYDVSQKKPTYPMWERLIRHSIRMDGDAGFLFPYHEYLAPTGDADEDIRRRGLLQEIAVQPDPSSIRAFSYAAELAPPDVALATLVRCLESVRKIRAHGIAKGSWERREEWLNAQIAQVWLERGAFPGLGSALEALGVRLGTALSLELIASKAIASNEDPWPLLDDIFWGKARPPQKVYEADVAAIAPVWKNLAAERRSLLKLLSRFALTRDQALRWYDTGKRAKSVVSLVTDNEVIENAYRICELDIGESGQPPISLSVIDRGLLPDSTITANCPVPEPSRVESPLDSRRCRAAIVAVLREAAKSGDALVSNAEVLHRVAQLDLAQACMIGSDWPMANRRALDGVVDCVEAVVDEALGKTSACLQLSDLGARERRLRSVLSARAAKILDPPLVGWPDLIKAAIQDSGGRFDARNERHAQALAEQGVALKRLLSRRLTVLVGRAGTGKTAVMGALMLCEPLMKGGVLLLAPTGKARVTLHKATNAEAMTVAQFLHRLGRYDGPRQRPLFDGKEKYKKEKTDVIDESSMLTMDDLVAIIEALDMAHVHRFILVGDPNQLPPIGVGRPFADLVAFLDATSDKAEDQTPLNNALGRLSVEVRSSDASGGTSDTLRLASWFTREAQPIDADRIISGLELGEQFNDLEISYWKTPQELRATILGALKLHLDLRSTDDVAGFDKSLGLNDKGWPPFESPQGAEQWQILSPVRMQAHGVYDLNRWIQRQFRASELQSAKQPWGVSLGEETIVRKDKVIQTVNQHRKAYDHKNRTAEKYPIANGEVGIITKSNGNLKVLFAGRPNVTFDYRPSQFSEGHAPLELAYVLTVHKSQGSEFRKVFVVIPKGSRLLSKELLYTALTRSRDRMVLLVEGDDASTLYDFTRPEQSETARRNTNLFHGMVRDLDMILPHAEHLIHRTQKGHYVRSKSELVIANMLCELGIDYHYERVCEGVDDPTRLRPDFSFITAAGDVIIWEHLGMLNRPDYARGWEWKKSWYARNGFREGTTLFTSRDDERGGLDALSLRNTALVIKELLA